MTFALQSTSPKWRNELDAAGTGSGPLTSVALAGFQTVSDDTETAVTWDTEEASANLVGGVPTVPADDVYEVDWSVLAAGSGTTGSVVAKAVGSTSGDLDKDEEPATSAGFIGTLGGSRRVALVEGETLSVTIRGTTGADLGIGTDVAANFLQFRR